MQYHYNIKSKWNKLQTELFFPSLPDEWFSALPILLYSTQAYLFLMKKSFENNKGTTKLAVGFFLFISFHSLFSLISFLFLNKIRAFNMCL